jgi:hypothetical protein
VTALPPDAVVEMGDGFVLLGPAAAVHVARALALVERQQRLDGIRAPQRWVALREAATRAAAFAAESAKVRESASMPQFPQGPDVRVGVGRVAELACCSEQWARALCRRGEFATARQLGGTWLVDEDEVVAWAVARAGRGEAVA